MHTNVGTSLSSVLCRAMLIENVYICKLKFYTKTIISIITIKLTELINYRELVTTTGISQNINFY